MKDEVLMSPKQIQFIQEADAKYNLAHGSVSSGKTVCTLYAFLRWVFECPGDSIAIFGYSMGSVYNNVVSLLYNSEELSLFRPLCNWSSKGVLSFGLKNIICIGAGDEGALGKIQGITLDLCYCDEMTLYPEVVIDMIQTRLRRDHSKLFAAMNPKQPSHKCKQWIDRAESDPDYYALHFVLDDNVFLSESYKADMRRSSSGLFFKRNILGIWCLAEGAIYDFFDPKLHVVVRPPRAAEYWICGIDYGTRAPFCCLLIGVSTGRFDQTGRKLWVEKEYYWDSAVRGRQKTNSELAADVQRFIADYAVRGIYVDPSCAAFKLDLQRLGIHCIDANNDVDFGIQSVATEMYKGNLVICSECTNLIKEIEAYVWDAKKAQKGEDAPLKGSGIADHACDALRYAIATHKVPKALDGDGKTLGGFGRV
jgi:PBSX family phage terminase large subunit